VADADHLILGLFHAAEEVIKESIEVISDAERRR